MTQDVRVLFFYPSDFVQELDEQRARHAERVAAHQERQMELELKHGADQVLALILPVSLCMVVVIATIRSVSFFSTNDTQFVYVPVPIYWTNRPSATRLMKNLTVTQPANALVEPSLTSSL